MLTRKEYHALKTELVGIYYDTELFNGVIAALEFISEHYREQVKDMNEDVN